jgi:putative hydrolase of the HAD superfamily
VTEPAGRAPAGGLLLVFPEREDAEAVADELAGKGWAPAEVHRERLAGDDDPEAVEWVVTLSTAPDSAAAAAHRAELEALADTYDGFVTAWDH